MDFTLLQPNEIDWKNVVLIGHDRHSPVIDTRQPMVFDVKSKTFIKCTMEPSIKFISCSSLGISLPRMPVKIWNRCGDIPSLPFISEVCFDVGRGFPNFSPFLNTSCSASPYVIPLSNNIAWCGLNDKDVMVHATKVNHNTFVLIEDRSDETMLFYVRDTPHVQEIDDLLTMTSPIFGAERDFISDTRPVDILRHGIHTTSRCIGTMRNHKPHILRFYINVPKSSNRFVKKVCNIINDVIGDDFEFREALGSPDGKRTEVIYVEIKLPNNPTEFVKYKAMLGKLAAYIKLFSDGSPIHQQTIVLG